jgi:tetratricopeptide (TPR) repeat protein
MVRDKCDAFAIGGKMDPLDLDDLDELEAVLAELRISQKRGNLILCTVASPAYRDKVIRFIKDKFSSIIVSVEEGDQLISALKSIQPKAEEVLIWIMPEALNNDILQALNNFRELFYKTGIPSLIFLTPAGLDQVISDARDFWRYRGGYHELKGTEKGISFKALETLSSSLSIIYRNKEELIRRKNINEYLLEKIKDEGERLKIFLELGTIHYLLSDYCKSVEYSEQAFVTAREIGDRSGEGRAMNTLGLAYSDLVDPRKAIEYYEQALKISREIGDRGGEGAVLGNLGNAYSDLGEPRKAIEYHEQALKISRETGYRRNEGIWLSSLGNTYLDLGEPRKAIEYHEQALKISREIGDRRVEGAVLSNLGSAYSDLGEPRKAIEYYEQALKISREIGDRRGEGFDIINMGLALNKLNQRQEAIEHAKAALAIFEQIESHHAEAVRQKLAEWQA